MRKLKIVFIFILFIIVAKFSYANMEKGSAIQNNNQAIVSVSSIEVGTNMEFYLILNLSQIEYNKFTVKIANTSNTSIGNVPEGVTNVSANSNQTSFTVDKNSISLEKLAVVYISPAQEGSVNFDVTITSLEEELTTLKSQLEKITSEIEELQNELQTLNNSTNIESQNVITENITNTEVENSTTTSNTETEQKINNIKKSIEEKTATKRELEEKIANYTEKTITTSISVKVTQNSIEEKSDLADKEDKKLLGQDDKEMTSMISSMKKMMNQVQELEGNLKTANDTINSMTASVTYQGSQNNYLSTLSLSEVELKNAFKKTTQTYFATVGNDVSNVTVNATAEDSSAIVTVYGNENLQTGKNKILITVTADDGSTRTYKVYVTKQ